MHYYAQNPLIKRDNHFTASFGLVVYVLISKMAWHKALAEAGLAGLEPWEAARGVMLVPEFQNILDPLDPLKGSFLLESVFKYNTSMCTVQCTMSKVAKQFT